MGEKRLPDRIVGDTWMLHSQLVGALALLQTDDAWSKSDDLQAVDWMLQTAIAQAKRLQETIGEYATAVDHERHLREQEA